MLSRITFSISILLMFSLYAFCRSSLTVISSLATCIAVNSSINFSFTFSFLASFRLSRSAYLSFCHISSLISSALSPNISSLILFSFYSVLLLSNIPFSPISLLIFSLLLTYLLYYPVALMLFLYCCYPAVALFLSHCL